jgi:hypothetical protein
MKLTKLVVASFLILAMASPACAKEGRRRPKDNGRPDKTDHVRPTPHNNG